MNQPVSRRVRLDTGIELGVLEWGNPNAEHTVVLVHGFLDMAWGWAPTVEAGLAPAFHVVAADMRGHGDSDRVGAGGYYHFMDYVADLASLCAEVRRERLSVVGHSMGGSVASYYAGTYPDRVHRLALLEGMGPPEDSTPLPERMATWIAASARMRRESPQAYADVAEAAARLMSYDPLLQRERALYFAERATRVLPDGRRQFKHDPLHLTRGPYPYRLDVAESFWRAVTCPVLYVEGGKSSFRAFGDELERRLACFRDLRRHTLDDVGHMMQRHDPEALGRVLADFLR
jgi:pimeloyl-ACP methyl ester carboxylesterase